MATLVYDKDGNATKVVHAIDVQGWLDIGYSLENPKDAKAPAKKETPSKEK